MKAAVFVCVDCRYETGRWMGFCPQCGASRLEERAPRGVRTLDVSTLADEASSPPCATGVGEFDRVVGGGVMDGAAVLLGGEPGVGKSTLLLQIAGAAAKRGRRVLVVSAEETGAQVADRARRVGIGDCDITVVASTDVDRIAATAAELKPHLLLVDSIQTVSANDLSGSGGTPSQVRECGMRLIGLARSQRITVVLVGHVTKDGALAGPKLLEHMVDVVLYLEGETNRSLRFLRALKNRFGPAHEVGVFEMGSHGLIELPDPSGALLSGRDTTVPGTVAFPAVDGRRPLMVEVQALVTGSHTAQPRRSVTGLPPSRVHQVLAVLQQHCGLAFSGRDVYVSIAGGARIVEPAVDLPVALAVASSALERPIGDVAAWGEVGLTGRVRAVPEADRRRSEALRLAIPRIIAAEARTLGRIDDALAAAGLDAGSAPSATITALH